MIKKLLLTFLFPALAQAGNIHLTSDNHVLIRTEISDSSVTKAQYEIAKLVEKRGKGTYTIYLVLDSPGGSIDAGLNLIEYTKTVKNLETVTLFAASMASAIVEALPGKRNIIDTGILMFHRARGGVEGQFEDGELESRLGLYKRMVRRMEAVNASRLRISLDDYKKQVKDELWILGSESVSKNAADEVVSVTCSQDLIEGKEVVMFNFFFMSIPVEFSTCPMIKGGKLVNAEQKKHYEKYKKTVRLGF